MTVAELIAELQQHPEEMEVLVSAWVPQRPNRHGWTGDYYSTQPIGECHRINYDDEELTVFVLRGKIRQEDLTR